MEDRDLEFSVVSGSNEEMLFRCLDSLHKTLRTSKYSWSVTVTCNEAGTGLPGRVRARYPDATLIQNERSLEVAANHNRVLKSSHARYVWVLSDEVLILANAIQRVTEFMDRPGNARVGVVSPRLLNPDGSVQPSTHRFPAMSEILSTHSGLRKPRLSSRSRSASPESRWNEATSHVNGHDQTVDVDTLRGVCAAVRMKAIRQVGPMAEVAFAGGEETEWHHRFRELNWKVVFFPQATVIYYGGQTVRGGSCNRHPEYLRGALYFFRTSRSSAIFGAFCATLLGIFGVRTLYAWATRDKIGATVARRNTQVVWRGLRRNSQDSQLHPS